MKVVARWGMNTEDLLFYRGIAKGDLGLKAKPMGNDRFTIERSDAGPLSTFRPSLPTMRGRLCLGWLVG